MKKLLVLLKKEFQESVKEFKIFWIPLVFIVTAIMQPISMHLLPKLVSKNRGLILDPKFASPSGNSVLAGIFNQLNEIGIIVIAITLMSSIISEKNSGVFDLLFSKPINSLEYLLSKYLFYYVLFVLSAIVGMLAGWYYTNIYYSAVNSSLFVRATLFYLLWYLFVITIGITASAIFNSQIVAALITFMIPTILLVLNNLDWKIIRIINPAVLSSNASSVMNKMNLTADWRLNIIGSIGIIILLIMITLIDFKKIHDV
ncbi:ABC transporter permease [Xylocopilactobacillus apis]|uniref:ABC-2 type transporter transmembrane domain-containing protein n=1 Tax=Xylocopilactobacillus apis TaxID=2932183 RepID=A0AAU9DL45_9LACO|nr:ABC transporter permease [Xylocopilactobacillus apis]BDR56284.1 hypothetical protein KIMC2_08460 [Xylocopilactobacillus apis]